MSYTPYGQENVFFSRNFCNPMPGALDTAIYSEAKLSVEGVVCMGQSQQNMSINMQLSKATLINKCSLLSAD